LTAADAANRHADVLELFTGEHLGLATPGQRGDPLGRQLLIGGDQMTGDIVGRERAGHDLRADRQGRSSSTNAQDLQNIPTADFRFTPAGR